MYAAVVGVGRMVYVGVGRRRTDSCSLVHLLLSSKIERVAISPLRSEIVNFAIYAPGYIFLRAVEKARGVPSL